MIKNRSKYAILGILSLSPGTGYDIKKYCDTVISGFWNENFGHIYPTLKSLEQGGCIQQSPNSVSPRKTLYSITDKGMSELTAWLKEGTEPQPVRSEFMLKFLFSSRLPREEVVSALLAYKERAEMELSEYRQKEAALKSGAEHITSDRARFLMATLRRGVLSAQATVSWCEETIREFAD